MYWKKYVINLLASTIVFPHSFPQPSLLFSSFAFPTVKHFQFTPSRGSVLSVNWIHHGIGHRGIVGGFPAGVRDLSLLQTSHSGSGGHLTSYSTATGCSFPGVKRPGREADHSSPFSTEVHLPSWSAVSQLFFLWPNKSRRIRSKGQWN